ncbi:MAG: hypothetical protein IKQ39_05915 [Oscillospiraceae bacterium]|nr:hypothetical protein [Oscillospiraceae bacterium]
MRLFLIDYENVNSAGLHGIGQASQDDRVILFYSHAANTLSFEIMDEMIASNIMPERVCLERTGKNALDFQLVTFLGYLIAREKADAYYIISKDTGYQAAIAFCQEYFGVKVQLRPSMKSALGNAAKQTARHAAAEEPVPLRNAAKAKPAVKKQAEPQPKKKGKPASVSLRKKTTVIQVQPVGAPASVLPQTEAIPIDLETVLTLVQPPVTIETASEILHCLRDSRSKTEFHNALQQHFDNDMSKQYYHCMKPCFVTFAE